jgi:hypothetical protein
MKTRCLIVLVGLLVSHPCVAQVPACQNLATLAVPASGELGDMQYAAPSNHTTVEIIDGEDRALDPPFRRQITTAQWTVTDADLALIRQEGASPAKRPLRLRWSGGNNGRNRPCDTRLLFDLVPEQQPRSGDLPVSAQEWGATECAAAGARWQEEIRAERRKQDGRVIGVTGLLNCYFSRARESVTRIATTESKAIL